MNKNYYHDKDSGYLLSYHVMQFPEIIAKHPEPLEDKAK